LVAAATTGISSVFGVESSAIAAAGILVTDAAVVTIDGKSFDVETAFDTCP